ncbi:DNA polymerase III subunit delta' [bacterium]|nr:DNA polymerase III subunit delta' [bacterium]
MINFPGVFGHENAKERLLSAYQKDRIPSAYLFIGENGIGKSTLVKAFAQLINCETNDYCRQCPNCRLYDSGSHPDFKIVKPDGQFIKISQVHDLINLLSLKPAYAKKRIILVKDANRLNQEAANSFLKILEEPPLNTLIILMTLDETLLLETILSRCQKIQFAPLTKNNLKRILDKDYSINEEEIELVLNYSKGIVRKDFIANSAVLYTMRIQVFKILTGLSDESMATHFNLVDHWIKKELHNYFFEFCAHWIKDFCYFKDQQLELVTNRDLMGELKAMNLNYTKEQLLWAFNLTIETEMAVRLNAGKALAIESLLIQLKQVFAGALVI